MPEPTQNTEPTPVSAVAPAPLADQYDLGDSPEADATLVAPEVAPPEAATPPVAAPSRERRPDGTFLPKTPHSRQSVRMAHALGLSDEDLAGLEPGALDDVVYHLTEQRSRSATQADLDRSRQPVASTPGESKDSPGAPPPAVAEDPLGLTDESQYDPGLLGVLKAQAKRLKQLETRLEEVQGFQRSQVQGSMADRCDVAFAKHASVLGEAKRQDLEASDPFLVRRRAVLQLVDADRRPGTLEAKIDRAVAALYGSAPAASTSPAAPVAATAEAWREGSLARPTARAPAEPKGVRRAERAVAEYQKETASTNGAAEATTEGDDFL